MSLMKQDLLKYGTSSIVETLYMKTFMVTLILIIFIALPVQAAPTINGNLGIDASGFRNLSSALASPMTAGKTVIISDHLSINNKTTNRSIVVTSSGKINVTRGKILSINSAFSADLHQVFSGNGSVVFMRGAVEKIVPQWWSNDVVGINKATASAYAGGGGQVYVPPGHYIGTAPVEIHDNVELVGAGYTSWIENTAIHGFSKCAIITGNIGDITGKNGLYAENKYDIAAVEAGTVEVSFVNEGDATTFKPGDIVGISSFELWPHAFPENTPKYINLNVVKSMFGKNITLGYPIPDNYPDIAGNPHIRRMSGTVNGYNGQPLWMAKNVSIRNLRITQSTGLKSGWYALMLYGVGITVEDIYMDNVSTLIGSNALSHSSIRNVVGRFEAGFLDFADWQNNNKLTNIKGIRFADNKILNRLGVSIHSGSDIKVKNLYAQLGYYDSSGFKQRIGKVSLYKIHRGKLENSVIKDAGDAEAVLLGFGDDNEANGLYLDGMTKHGIVLAGGVRQIVRNCTIINVGTAGRAVYALMAAKDYTVHDNIFGIDGKRTVSDDVAQSNGFSLKAKVYSNIGYSKIQK